MTAIGSAEFALDTWRSDIILTTFDQFLLALMDARTKHQQRFHNLCDAIIVIDEVQAFPANSGTPSATSSAAWPRRPIPPPAR